MCHIDKAPSCLIQVKIHPQRGWLWYNPIGDKLLVHATTFFFTVDLGGLVEARTTLMRLAILLLLRGSLEPRADVETAVNNRNIPISLEMSRIPTGRAYVL